MRQVGTLNNEQQAILFTDYLLTQGILAQLDEEDEGQWSVWVRDEDQLDLAREELKEFQQDPTRGVYAASRAQAQDIRKEAVRRHEERRKNMVQVRDNWQRGRRAPLTFLLIAVCVGVSLITGFGKPRDGKVFTALLFNKDAFMAYEIDGRVEPVVQPGPDVFGNIAQGEIWRLVTPVFLHFGIWHLLGNCYWTYIFGSQIESRYKSWWLLGVVLLCAVIPNIAQAWFEGTNFGGFSGVAFGLFGYVWIKSRFDPSSNLHIDNFTVALMIGWFFLCMTNYMGPIANIAHGAGLFVGAAIAYLPLLLEGPRRE